MSRVLPDRLRGSVLGALVGDALGVPYEFHDARDLWFRPEMEPPDDFRRAHRGVAPGTWSDDGAQLLCLLAGLLQNGRLDVDDLGRRILNWHTHGYMAVDGFVFDVGVQTTWAIRALENGTPAIEAGPSAAMGTAR
jgi:ADP-ribosyl-[dinitrogen reductase] hydrolase